MFNFKQCNVNHNKLLKTKLYIILIYNIIFVDMAILI